MLRICVIGGSKGSDDALRVGIWLAGSMGSEAHLTPRFGRIDNMLRLGLGQGEVDGEGMEAAAGEEPTSLISRGSISVSLGFHGIGPPVWFESKANTIRKRIFFVDSASRGEVRASSRKLALWGTLQNPQKLCFKTR
jgi:hypothetical protein